MVTYIHTEFCSYGNGAIYVQSGDITTDVSNYRDNFNNFFGEIAQHGMVTKACNLNDTSRKVIILSH